MPRRAFIGVIVTVAVLAAAPARALSITDFEALPGDQQSAYIANFIEKMTADIGAKNPKLMQDIRYYFYHRDGDGKTVAEGTDRVVAEQTALDLLAKDGKVDLSKIQIEGVVVKVMKDKFPPQAAQQ
jgi:hypothetical protein